jgi:hypothetical protein
MGYSDFISTVGVIITGIFTALVWRATVRTAEATKAAADTAEATLKLNEDLAKREEVREAEFNKLMKIQLTPKILKESELAYNSVVDTSEFEIHRKLENAPKKLSVDIKEIAKYFSESEVKIILNAWETYDRYLSKYYQKTYMGDGMRALLDNAEPVIFGFNDLVQLFKYGNK